ncbi:right-handed parallel beta-helix repeat-containing protein [Pedobacter cryophilus]|uniref:Right-handed parallel beta-helix repeat-containing protein n=1 Tax=Pedobacter cryophilus TaxID=2571271 RepID=A0A4U1C238_9SPHI|nr:right-handed parallel beta-helix repeat-containing protein [Pedobacter cryophilus]TKB99077.1 right-handed parallel beta-helix repeat-containing protein [Pedobacter cryophilus]
MRKLLIVLALICCSVSFAEAKNYYFNAKDGSDSNNGSVASSPFKSFKKLSELSLKAGDSVLLAGGVTFNESLILKGLKGTLQNSIVITSYSMGKNNEQAKIDAKGFANGVLIQNCSFVEVKNLSITANGGKTEPVNGKLPDMRCGVLVTANYAGKFTDINLINLKIKDIYYEEVGFIRGKDEVKTANGTQKYGWGIRFINDTENALFENIKVEGCEISNVSHTGLKLTGRKESIQNIKLLNNKVIEVGGPGIQMSGVKTGLVSGNYVNGSGNKNDSRKWGRGSGLWTWGTSDVVIEKNSFLNANGPGDSAGCHIDYNCNNVIIQYNLSANNAGGFCEILGNNYNCAYRYNISVNDGYRVKGKNGAFQEGKIFWLSGYVGDKVKPKGPFNSYIYNNTIYTKSEMTAQVAVATSAAGVLVANNIFHIEGDSKFVAGDQLKAESLNQVEIENCFFENNLFLKKSSWPKDVIIQDDKPIYGDAKFTNKGGFKLEDYIPTNTSLIKDKGITINKINNDNIGLVIGLKVEYDILGNKIKGKPDMGAIEIK